MNEILSFFQDMINLSLSNQRPVGLSGFKHMQNPRPAIVKHRKKEELNISALLRKR